MRELTNSSDSGFHGGHLVDSAGLVISRPLAHLFAVLEVPRAHARAVLAKPLPITHLHFPEHVAPGPDATVLVQQFIRFWFDGHSISSYDGEAQQRRHDG